MSFLNHSISVDSFSLKDAEQFTKGDPKEAVYDMQKFLRESTPLILDNTADDIGEQLNQRRMKVEHYANSYPYLNETVCIHPDVVYNRKVYRTCNYIRLLCCPRGTLAHYKIRI